MTTSELEKGRRVDRKTYQNIGLILGPIIFIIMISNAGSQSLMPIVAWKVASVGLLMAIWWATEALPVAVTALLPLVTFDLFQISSIKQAAAPYSNPTIYLFLGAFILAIAVQRWGLHKRIAFFLLSKTGTNGKKLIGGFMMIAAILSMWMTNTSTTMMLLPIALSVISVILLQMNDLDDVSRINFQVSMLLGLAFAATIGGMSTLIGTPPNALFAAYMEETFQISISFFDWLILGVPLSMIMLFISWVVLTIIVYPSKVRESYKVRTHLNHEYVALGRASSSEKRVALIFGLVILFWIIRRPLANTFGIAGLSDASIALTGALLLFATPSGSNEQSKLLCWDDLKQLPWGVLILFGGGLSLASAISSSGLASWLAEGLSPLSVLGIGFVVFCATALVIFLTEMTSNLATTATFLPILGALALELGLSPLVLSVPITLAASCAFMLPVATPPNAVVFSSGFITIPQMIRAGLYLNVIGLGLLMIVSQWLVPIIF